MAYSLKVENFKARSLRVGRMELSWEVENTTVDVLDFTFRLYRSESGSGPWDALTPEFEDRYYFIDSQFPHSNKYRTLFYKLVVKHKKSGDTTEFGPYSPGPEPDLIASYIRQSEETLFTQATGRQCWVFPVRTFGTRCRACWDPVLHAKTSSSCSSCYDTGFIRGYMNPFECWIQIDPNANELLLQEMQEDQRNVTSARMTFYPPMKPRDLIVEAENKRWRVVRVTPSERLRATIKQELVIREVQPTDIEYNIPINITEALKSLQPSPSRMYSLPHNLDNVINERSPNAFAIYTTRPQDNDE